MAQLNSNTKVTFTYRIPEEEGGTWRRKGEREAAIRGGGGEVHGMGLRFYTFWHTTPLPDTTGCCRVELQNKGTGERGRDGEERGQAVRNAETA